MLNLLKLFFAIEVHAMKKVILLILLMISFSLYSETVEITVPDLKIMQSEGLSIPQIEGYEIDGTGEKVLLPYKDLVFSGKITKVEIVEKENVNFDMPLKKGAPLVRLSDLARVKPVNAAQKLLPSIDKFTFINAPSFKREKKIVRMKFYPLIPLGETKGILIKKIRVHTEGTVNYNVLTAKKGRDSMIVLTTEDFKSNSTELANYIDAKRADGFRVDIFTEKDFGGDELKGPERVEKIREFLRTIYKDYYFLLIFAEPTPGGKGIPMITTMPNYQETDNPGYEPVPTDIFYAELSEPMNSNGNAVYGERADGIKLDFELVVGRIPFYNEIYHDADKILRRTINYIQEKPSEAAYRKKMFFPTSIAYYPMQDGRMGMPKMDGAYVVRYLEENILDESFTTKTLVEKSGGDPSEYTEEEELSYASMLSNWNDGYGAVYWMGHGMPTYSVKTIWTGDRNGNGYADSYELKSETFVDSEMTEQMKDLSPFVFMGSCLNGTVENPRNLGFKVLLNSAVGVIASSQVSYGSIYKNYSKGSQDLFAYGTVFIEALAENNFPAWVLQYTKESWSNSSVLLTVKYEMNYLGDPSLRLNTQECNTDSECDDNIFCNGTEVCSEGFCQKNFDALPCAQDGNTSCKSNVCNEDTKSCEMMPRPDGFFCGTTKNLCFERKTCQQGECVESGATDCSKYDSVCSEGTCNSKTGECEKVALNEGDSCDDGLFCTVDAICSEGSCVGDQRAVEVTKPCTKTVCNDSTEDFSFLSDIEQNWKECENDSGEKGTCYYGVCEISEEESSDSSSGCSAVLL